MRKRNKTNIERYFNNCFFQISRWASKIVSKHSRSFLRDLFQLSVFYVLQATIKLFISSKIFQSRSLREYIISTTCQNIRNTWRAFVKWLIKWRSEMKWSTIRSFQILMLKNEHARQTRWYEKTQTSRNRFKNDRKQKNETE